MIRPAPTSDGILDAGTPISIIVLRDDGAGGAAAADGIAGGKATTTHRGAPTACSRSASPRSPVSANAAGGHGRVDTAAAHRSTSSHSLFLPSPLHSDAEAGGTSGHYSAALTSGRLRRWGVPAVPVAAGRGGAVVAAEASRPLPAFAARPPPGCSSGASAGLPHLRLRDDADGSPLSPPSGGTTLLSATAGARSVATTSRSRGGGRRKNVTYAATATTATTDRPIAAATPVSFPPTSFVGETEQSALTRSQTSDAGRLQSTFSQGVSFISATLLGRWVTSAVSWLFGAHFVHPEDSYDVVLRKIVLSAAPLVVLIISAPIPYYFYQIHTAMRNPVDLPILAMDDAVCPGVPVLRAARPSQSELGALLTFAIVTILWVVASSAVSIYCRLSGVFSARLSDVWLGVSTVVACVGLMTHAYVTPFYAAATSILALTMRATHAHAIAAVHACIFIVHVVNILTGWKASFTHYRGNPQNAMTMTATERAFYYALGLVAFVVSYVAVDAALRVIEQQTAKLQGSLRLSKQLAALTRSYDVDRMREALEVYGTDPDCDREILMTQRAVLANLEAYRPHIPAFFLDQARSSTSSEAGSDAEDVDLQSAHVYQSHSSRGQPHHRSFAESNQRLTDISTTGMVVTRGGGTTDRLTPLFRPTPNHSAITAAAVTVGSATQQQLHRHHPHQTTPMPPLHQQHVVAAVYRGIVSYFRLQLDDAVLLRALGAATVPKEQQPTKESSDNEVHHNNRRASACVGSNARASGLVTPDSEAAVVNAARLVELLLIECFRAAEATHGSVLGAVGDEITVAWNAARRTGRAGVKACNFALLLRDAAPRCVAEITGGRAVTGLTAAGGSSRSAATPALPKSTLALRLEHTGHAAGSPITLGSNSPPSQSARSNHLKQQVAAALPRAFTSYITTTPASCFFAGDAKQRLFVTLAGSEWHPRAAGLTRVAREVAAAATAPAADVSSPPLRPVSAVIDAIAQSGGHVVGGPAATVWSARRVESPPPPAGSNPAPLTLPYTVVGGGNRGSNDSSNVTLAVPRASLASRSRRPSVLPPLAIPPPAALAPTLLASPPGIDTQPPPQHLPAALPTGQPHRMPSNAAAPYHHPLTHAAVVTVTDAATQQEAQFFHRLRAAGTWDVAHGAPSSAAAPVDFPAAFPIVTVENTTTTIDAADYVIGGSNSPTATTTQFVVYELLGEHSFADVGGDDEWMYELQRM